MSFFSGPAQAVVPFQSISICRTAFREASCQQTFGSGDNGREAEFFIPAVWRGCGGEGRGEARVEGYKDRQGRQQGMEAQGKTRLEWTPENRYRWGGVFLSGGGIDTVEKGGRK